MVQQHFRQQAVTFDSLYDGSADGEGLVQKLLRPMMFLRKDFAVDVVREKGSPRVLDVGCGSGRVAEELLDAGAGGYVGVDFSEPMVEMSRERLSKFGDAVELITGDFMTADLQGKFDVIVGVGFFDYIEDPVPFARRFFELSNPGGVVVASFPTWSLVKGTARKVRYEVINDCPIFDYTQRELDFLFRGAGFATVDCIERDAGILMRAQA